MAINKDFYDVSDHMDRLREGWLLRLHHEVHFKENSIDLSALSELSLEQLDALREASVAAEKEINIELRSRARKWEKQAALTALLDQVIEYHKMPEVEHTSNRWQHIDRYDGDEISNRVYQMTVRLDEETTFDHIKRQTETFAWSVTWAVRFNTPTAYGTTIAGQNRKRFTDKDKALKYIEGRKKAYAHLFTEISPPIPEQYAYQFEKNGILLPGYTVEDREPMQPEHTAAELLGALGYGDFLTGDKKPSVLGQLSETKKQTAETPKPPKPTKNQPDR